VRGKEEMLHTALVKGTGCEFTKIYDSRSDIEGVKGLREKGTHFMLEKWDNNLKYAQINNFYAIQQFTIFFHIT